MIYTLAITLCLASAPEQCTHYQQPFTAHAVLPTYAYVEAQEYVAKWMEQHPGMTLKAWRMRPGEAA